MFVNFLVKNLTLIYVVVGSSCGFALSPLATAESHYDNKRYDEAIKVYEELVEEGFENSSLYFNLGNSYYRSGQVGRAIASYLAARQYNPRDPDIIANLNHAHKNTTDQLELNVPASSWDSVFFWRNWFVPKEIYIFALIFWCLSLCFLFISQIRSSLTGLKATSYIGFVLTFFMFCLFYIEKERHESWGAVVSPEVKIRSGPGEHNLLVFELHEGAPFILEDSKGEWLRIQLANGKRGWVLRDDIAVY